MINTPQNPTGKVFTQAEYDLIAKLCQKYDAIAVIDEVYEHIIFDNAKAPHHGQSTGHERSNRYYFKLRQNF